MSCCCYCLQFFTATAIAAISGYVAAVASVYAAIAIFVSASTTFVDVAATKTSLR